MRGEQLFCSLCNSVYPIRDSVAILFPIDQPSVSIDGKVVTLEETKRIYDRVYAHDDLMGTDLDKLYDQDTKSQLLRFCGPMVGKRLLDLGTGAGNLWDYVPSGVLGYAVDISETGARKAMDRYKGLTAIAAVGERLPFPDNFFDSIIAADTIEHTISPQNTLSEIYRVLKPGSIFAASFPTPASLSKWGKNQVISGNLSPKFLLKLMIVLFHRARLFGKFAFQPIDRDIDISGWRQMLEEENFYVDCINMYPSSPQTPMVYLVETIKR